MTQGQAQQTQQRKRTIKPSELVQIQTTDERQVIKNLKEYKGQVTKNASMDNLGIDIIDKANIAYNKTSKICIDSNNRNW